MTSVLCAQCLSCHCAATVQHLWKDLCSLHSLWDGRTECCQGACCGSRLLAGCLAPAAAVLGPVRSATGACPEVRSGLRLRVVQLARLLQKGSRHGEGCSVL